MRVRKPLMEECSIPKRLADSCTTPQRRDWLAALPDTIARIEAGWNLERLAIIDNDDVSCSWVAVVRRDRDSAVLKIGMPHMEGRDEIAGLRFWNGAGVVRMMESDDHSNAMLLEHCQPGDSLRSQPAPCQDVVIADSLKQLWRLPSIPNPFRPLQELIDYWRTCTLSAQERWSAVPFVRDGLEIFGDLCSTPSAEALLHTDLHAGNVLRAERSDWLVIDPKPFIGDRAFDATQHILNCRDRLLDDARTFTARVSALLDVDVERVRKWTFARLSAEPRERWHDTAMTALARAVRETL